MSEPEVKQKKENSTPSARDKENEEKTNLKKASNNIGQNKEVTHKL
ncbi:MAG: hypothetical protein AABX38_01525 [Candidatus Micrarchaeota archaeon]